MLTNEKAGKAGKPSPNSSNVYPKGWISIAFSPKKFPKNPDDCGKMSNKVHFQHPTLTIYLSTPMQQYVFVLGETSTMLFTELIKLSSLTRLLLSTSF